MLTFALRAINSASDGNTRTSKYYLVVRCCADIEEVLESLPELTRVNVNGCISLSRLVLKACTKLEWLDCSGCAHLHNISTLSSALSHMTAVACQRLVVGLTSKPCQQVM